MQDDVSFTEMHFTSLLNDLVEFGDRTLLSNGLIAISNEDPQGENGLIVGLFFEENDDVFLASLEDGNAAAWLIEKDRLEKFYEVMSKVEIGDE
jgi:hypothetical protein